MPHQANWLPTTSVHTQWCLLWLVSSPQNNILEASRLPSSSEIDITNISECRWPISESRIETEIITKCRLSDTNLSWGNVLDLNSAFKTSAVCWWHVLDTYLNLRSALWPLVSNPESPRAHPQANGGSAPGWDHHAQGLHLRHPGRQRHRRAELLPGPHAAAWRHHEDVTGHQRRHECAGDCHFFRHHGWVANSWWVLHKQLHRCALTLDRTAFKIGPVPTCF